MARAVPTPPPAGNLLAPVAYAAGAAQFVVAGEVLLVRHAHGHEARAHLAIDMDGIVTLHI